MSPELATAYAGAIVVLLGGVGTFVAGLYKVRSAEKNKSAAAEVRAEAARLKREQAEEAATLAREKTEFDRLTEARRQLYEELHTKYDALYKETRVLMDDRLKCEKDLARAEARILHGEEQVAELKVRIENLERRLNGQHQRPGH